MREQKQRKNIHPFDREKGFALIEIVMVIVILGIAVIPLTRLAMKNNTESGKYALMTTAMNHAEEAMEQMIADYAAVNAGRGYDWVITNWSGASTPDPPAGFSGTVSISAEATLNDVTYVVVTVTVSNSEISDVVLTTWLTS